MPTINSYLGYNIYIWTNEGNPVEPIHVHVWYTYVRHADKFWLTKDGRVLPSSKNKMLSKRDAAKIISYLSDTDIQESIKAEWVRCFGEIDYKE